jgi:NADH:ubiquinone oxidoreductase subunit 2 (subunit N)
VSSAFASFPSAADYAALLPMGIVACTPLLILFVDLFVATSSGTVAALAVGVAIVGLVAPAWSPRSSIRTTTRRSAAPSSQGGFSIVFSEIVIVATVATLLLSDGVGRTIRLPARPRCSCGAHRARC